MNRQFQDNQIITTHAIASGASRVFIDARVPREDVTKPKLTSQWDSKNALVIDICVPP